MKKKWLAFSLLLVLLTSVFPAAQADTLVLQDPAKFCSVLDFDENRDSEHCLIRVYRAEHCDDVSEIALAYLELLLQSKELVLADYTDGGEGRGGMHYFCFVPAEGYSYDTFHLINNDIGWKTIDSCLILFYNPGANWITVYTSTDFSFADLGKRMNETSLIAVNKRDDTSHSSTCTYCDGTGKCKDCGGDMWVTDWEWVYINGSPESQLVTKLCDGIYCYGGACSKCYDYDD